MENVLGYRVVDETAFEEVVFLLSKYGGSDTVARKKAKINKMYL